MSVPDSELRALLDLDGELTAVRDVDVLVLRENASGIYQGEWARDETEDLRHPPGVAVPQERPCCR